MKICWRRNPGMMFDISVALPAPAAIALCLLSLGLPVVSPIQISRLGWTTVEILYSLLHLRLCLCDCTAYAPPGSNSETRDKLRNGVALNNNPKDQRESDRDANKPVLEGVARAGYIKAGVLRNKISYAHLIFAPVTTGLILMLLILKL